MNKPDKIDGWHQELIAFFAWMIKPKVYVELGLGKADTFNKVLPWVQSLAVACDVENHEHYIDARAEYNFYKGTTDDFCEMWKAIYVEHYEIDILFIDADHRTEQVATDFENFFPYVAPHGLIFLHDTHPESQEYADRMNQDCWQAIEALSKYSLEYEMVTIPVQPGLTICRKRTRQLNWKEEK